jgi:hypothetical protein
MGLAQNKELILCLCPGDEIVLCVETVILDDWRQLGCMHYSDAASVIYLQNDQNDYRLYGDDGYILWKYAIDKLGFKQPDDLPNHTIDRLEYAKSQYILRMEATRARKARDRYEQDRIYWAQTELARIESLPPETNHTKPKPVYKTNTTQYRRNQTNNQKRQLYGRPVRSK